ncbi:TetR family transcriptional regulator [Mycobacterium sp. 20091114027_K0903767]|uniref:TetR/AcrR family transcriptional regulator n=1 Tax=Mycolicibacterium porcinum TaxID=39693 RepID=UPI001196B580|nr:TetR family transcriptional regulator [Mycolicibacterium porcinum]MBX8685840.1 TetR family transcriptional regulator [Mycobacterium sp. 20091114027_K0903767]TVX94847.1 helix-turn-helix transcriptional regulator [Mycolicibacterium porcinum]
MTASGAPARVTRVGGRPPLIAVSDIVTAGRELGMRNLSVNAVAARLGVSATALYRHISGRWELERLVGESLLAELEFVDDPARSVEEHLLAFGVNLHRFTLSNPGLATYMQVLFPRGEAGARLLADEIAALGRRGYAAEAAALLSSSVAVLAIGLAAQHELKAEASGGDEFVLERDAAAERLAGDAELGPVHTAGAQLRSPQYLELLMNALIRGLLTSVVPGRAITDIVADLTAGGEDR